MNFSRLLKKAIMLCTIIFTCNLYASEISMTYNHHTLEDDNTGEKAQGLHSAGIKGDLFHLFYFKYEHSFNSESQQEYAASANELENYIENLQAGLKVLPFLDNNYLNKLYIEYQKDSYEISYETINKYYVQENIFAGYLNHDEENDMRYTIGLFLHNNNKEWLNKDTNEFISEENKDVYGLAVRVENLFFPYQNGKPLGLRKYGTGILIDDMQIQYQIAGGDDYFFTTGLGLAHRSKWLNIYAKYVFEITTDTQASKLIAGLGVFF